MPKVTTTTTGIYPKVAPTATDCPSLRATLHQLDRGEIEKSELETVIQANIKRAVIEQVAAGIDLPTDGLLRWTDLYSPFVAAWSGLTRRGIHRFYDTNTLYGEPVVEGEIKYAPSQTLADYQYAQTIHPTIKAVLPGVFTFAVACQDTHYKDSKQLRSALATALLQEAQAYIDAGAKYIELHEPELGWSESDLAEVKEVYTRFAALDVQIIVISYFRNFSPAVVAALIEAGVGIGIDTTKPHERPPSFAGVTFQLGIVDSRETRLESADQLADKQTKILTIFAEAEEILFSTSSHVEYLPHAKALAKIALLKAK